MNTTIELPQRLARELERIQARHGPVTIVTTDNHETVVAIDEGRRLLTIDQLGRCIRVEHAQEPEPQVDPARVYDLSRPRRGLLTRLAGDPHYHLRGNEWRLARSLALDGLVTDGSAPALTDLGRRFAGRLHDDAPW